MCGYGKPVVKMTLCSDAPNFYAFRSIARVLTRSYRQHKGVIWAHYRRIVCVFNSASCKRRIKGVMITHYGRISALP